MKKNNFIYIAVTLMIVGGILFSHTTIANASEIEGNTTNESIKATASATDNLQSVTIKLFYGEGCPHCREAESFLNKIKGNYSNLNIQKFEVYHNQDNQNLMQLEAKKLGATVRGVPFIIIGSEYTIGYQSDLTTGQQLVSIINNQSGIEKLPTEIEETLTPDDPGETSDLPDAIAVPILGEIKVGSLSLPLFTILVAAIDGFNPCAMWTLLFLISLLLGMKDRRRMWLLGSVFLITSGFIYFIFLAAWLQFFSFFGYMRIMQVGIGALAFCVGGYYLWDFWKNRNGGCLVANNEKRKKVFLQLKEITLKKQLIVAILGMVGLAVAVNLVELVCSAGLPAIYTQVLSLSSLSWWQYYAYLLLYIFVFMVDDLLIFFTAMITLKAVGIESKYGKFSHLVGGILLLLIGIALLIRPELLMIG